MPFFEIKSLSLLHICKYIGCYPLYSIVRSIITYNLYPYFKMNQLLILAGVGRFNTLHFRPDRYRRKEDVRDLIGL